MEDYKIKQLSIGKCKIILLVRPVKIYRFGDAYTVKDKTSGDTIFELKSAEYCGVDDTKSETCECLIINKEKLLIGRDGDELLNMIKTMYDNQNNATKEIQDDPNQPNVLKHLDKYLPTKSL